MTSSSRALEIPAEAADRQINERATSEGRGQAGYPVPVLAPARPELIEPSNIQNQTADWLLPGEEQQGLRRYVQTIRERCKLIALDACWSRRSPRPSTSGPPQKTYKAEADLLVTPIAGQDTTLNGSRADPRVERPDARRPDRGAACHDDRRRAARPNAEAQHEPHARARCSTTSRPLRSRRATSSRSRRPARRPTRPRTSPTCSRTPSSRTAPSKLHDQLDAAIKALRAAGRQRSDEAPGAQPEPAPDPAQRARDAARRQRPDDAASRPRPTCPPAAAWPKRNLSIIAGIIAGLALGIGGAFAAQVFDPRLRREDQLRALYRPADPGAHPEESRARTESAIAPHQLSPAGVEAYRTLRATLDGAARRVGAPAQRR